MSLFKELKRRNVFKVSIAYIVMAWLVMQLTDIVLNNITAPEWVFRVVMLFLTIGFPLAVFFAWEFEMTPEGIKREHEVDRSQSTNTQTGRKIDFMIIGVLVLTLSYFAYDKLVLSTARDAALIEATKQVVAEQAVTEQEESAELDKSIAVLAFANMSADPEQEYFSDGIAEEILNGLAQLPDLKVAARTSAFSFKGQNTDIRQIGETLNVNYILEGSVRKAGDRLRITAQLISVEGGYHLWSETYNRTFDDIFAIQDEIASAVVMQLKITLMGAPPTTQEVDPAAYAIFLQARHLSYQGTPEALEQSIALYRRVLEINPGYASAWAGMAYIYSFQRYFESPDYKETYSQAIDAANQALALDPANAIAYAILGTIAAVEDLNYEAAARLFERALTLEPTNHAILAQAAQFTANLGRTKEAIAVSEYLIARDPINPVGHLYLGWWYIFAGRLDEGIASEQTALRLSPGNSLAHFAIGIALLQKDEPDAALVAMKLEPLEHMRLNGLTLAQHKLGHTTESDAALAELIEKYAQSNPTLIAGVLAGRDEVDRAFKWLEIAVQSNDPLLSEIGTGFWAFLNIEADPRWPPLLKRIGMSPAQLDAIEFNVTLPE